MKHLEESELRIGNYVDLYGNVTQIYRSDFSKTEHGIAIEEGKPITLTEEWLGKLGFVKDLTHLMNVWELKPITLHKQDGLFWCDILWDSLEIKSVHQLQNLYYALTGEEVTIKN